MNDEFENRDDSYEFEDDYYDEKPKRRFSLKRLLVKLLCLLLIIFICILSVGFYKYKNLSDLSYILLMATDESGQRTDTLMLFCFNKTKNEIDIISIPRDTLVEVSDYSFEKMSRDYPVPDSQFMKINAINLFGGEKHGIDILCNEVENLLDISIDHYMMINFETFRYIVDELGGIDFYVPEDMEYHDPYQDLHISLKEGQQILNGDQAEQLVRFRSGYANGDLGRIEVQQSFMKALLSKVLSKRTMISRPGIYFDLFFGDKYVKSDVGFSDALGYYFAVNGFNSDSMVSYTLPGYAGMYKSQSVYFIDKKAFLKLIDSFKLK